jgi:hypothetical protein
LVNRVKFNLNSKAAVTHMLNTPSLPSSPRANRKRTNQAAQVNCNVTSVLLILRPRATPTPHQDKDITIPITYLVDQLALFLCLALMQTILIEKMMVHPSSQPARTTLTPCLQPAKRLHQANYRRRSRDISMISRRQTMAPRPIIPRRLVARREGEDLQV